MKRFTETTKWSDPWFRKLAPASKLLWLYLCDNCDQAGVIEVDYEVASVHIGEKVDERVLEGLGNRVITLSCGKVFIPQFIKFQHGTPSTECKAHNPIFASMEKYDLERVLEGYEKGINTPLCRVQVKVEGKEKETVQENAREKKSDSAKNLPTTEVSKRIHVLFHRRPDTAWSDKEVKAYRAIGNIDLLDLGLVEVYYAAERAKGDDGKHRRDLLTFLNNFPGELDRARAKAPKQQTSLPFTVVTETSVDRAIREFEERERKAAQ